MNTEESVKIPTSKDAQVRMKSTQIKESTGHNECLL